MRNLFLLLLRFHSLILFIVLQLVSFFLIASYNSFQSAAIYTASRELTGGVHQRVDNVISYFSLAEAADSLAAENARLRSQLDSLLAQRSSSGEELTRIKAIYPISYSFIPSKVIYSSVNRRNNYFTLDIGKDHLVSSARGVIGPQGIVGTIAGSSSSFSTGLSVLNGTFKVSARIEASGEVGSLSWDGRSPEFAQLQEIPRHISLQKGQRVVVSQHSFLFPEGVPIGQIESYSLPPGGSFYNIEVKLYTDFRNLERVYVVINDRLQEKEQLEQKVIE